MIGYNTKATSPLQQNDFIVASALSGFLGRAVVQPLDVVKVRFQLQVEPLRDSTVQGKYRSLIQAIQLIFREEGGTAFWKGHVYAQCQAVSFVTLQFYSYEMLTQVLNRYATNLASNPALQSTSHFFCGSVAGCAATVVTQPLDVLRARFIAQGEPRIYRGFLHAINHMVAKEGIQGFYRGLLPSVLLTAPQSGIQFTFYHFVIFVWNAMFSTPNRMQKDAITPPSNNVGVMQSFVAGGAAGALAKLAVYPLDTTKRRLQVQGFEEARARFGRLHHSRGLLNCLATIGREEGLAALYKGIQPSLLKSMLSVGFRFCTYEQLCNIIRGYRTNTL